MVLLSIIDHNAVREHTVKKIAKNLSDPDTMLAIAKSNFPELVADISEKNIRTAVINNEQTSLDILLGYLKEQNTPDMQHLLIRNLAKHPYLTESTIEKLLSYASDNPTIMLMLFETLHKLRHSNDMSDFINQKLNLVWNAITKHYTSFTKHERQQLIQTLLAISNPLPEMRPAIDDTLRTIALDNTSAAIAIVSSPHTVNALTIDALLNKYIQPPKFNLNVLAALARRSDITMNIATTLKQLDNKQVTLELLVNERIMPVFTDDDLQKLTTNQIPLHIKHQVFLDYLEEHRKNIDFLRKIARKSTLTPHALILMHSTGDPKILAEFAAKKIYPKELRKSCVKVPIKWLEHC